jgi:RNA polymerase sigma-70 factor, ECF subfamily
MVVLDVEAECPTERTNAEAVRRSLVAQLPVLRAVARGLCRSAAELEGLVHDVLDTALRSLEAVEVRDNPRGAMVKILHELHIERCRARQGAQGRGREPQAARPEPTVVPAWSSATGDDIRRAASQLPDELRAVYVRIALEGRGYAEVAAELGISEPAVAARLRGARARLKQALIAKLGTEPT